MDLASRVVSEPGKEKPLGWPPSTVRAPQARQTPPGPAPQEVNPHGAPAPYPIPPPALHLIDGRWVSSRSTCGCTLAERWRQDRVERKAARRACPVCVEVA